MSNDEIVSRTRLLDSEIKVCAVDSHVYVEHLFACILIRKYTLYSLFLSFYCTSDFSRILVRSLLNGVLHRHVIRNFITSVLLCKVLRH